MAETKEKIGSIRRFGARYGRTPRLRFGKIEQEQRKHHKCPYCMNVTVKRLSAGIWECKKCNAKFTGKAYTIKKKKGCRRNRRRSNNNIRGRQVTDRGRNVNF